MTEKLFRITSFPTFQELVKAQSLSFVTYDTWHDPYEGYLLRALQFDEGRKRITKWLDQRRFFDIPSTVVVDSLVGFRKTVHMQSWSRKHQSEAMWKLYSYNGEALRIATSLVKVKQLTGVLIVPVKYTPIGLEKELRRVFRKNKIEVGQVFARKGNEYSHEEEVRLMTSIDMNWLNRSSGALGAPPEFVRQTISSLVDRGAISTDELETSMKSFYAQACVKQVPFSHVENFVESVMVGPTATKQFSETVRRFCVEHGIHFEGASKLYAFELK